MPSDLLQGDRALGVLYNLAISGKIKEGLYMRRKGKSPLACPEANGARTVNRGVIWVLLFGA
jgi:hypothetical protein